ncbi:CoA transferase [Marivibrio halodurans]|uniref:CoA transferase n=1 Tax=Marivibrio halodurans TaxID=2039722 RepID=A0A8J7V3N3_9PROT|nr:CoA transferase [Marivibrio halodurans]MBP5858555.1 CoA transferase [Marivibrio halodurans]
MKPESTSRLARFGRGIKVLDLSQYLPGPMASLLLADMGAEVLKIEPPRGDPMRGLGPRDDEDRALFYEAINAGKKVLRLDLRQEKPHREFLDLVRDADVLIEGFRPGTMKRLGLDYETLRGINPRLIYCSMSGWGKSGPMAQAAGHDGNYLAMAGILHRNGAGSPYVFDPPLADTSAALFAVISILGALNARREDNKGCEIDIALADIAMPLQLFQIADFGARSAVPQPESTYLNSGAAYYRVYETKDGRHIMLGAVEEKFWRAFCVAAERGDWIERQAAPTPQSDLIREVSDYFRSLTYTECLERFGEVDCCLSPVLDLRQALETPHFKQRKLIRRSPEGDLQALFPVRVDDQPSPSRPPLSEEPALWPHSREAKTTVPGK